MPEFFVDLSAASNGSGMESSPYNSFASINSGGAWARGNAIRVKRGSRGILGASTRANIECTTGSGRLLVTAYGDPLDPMPVLDGGNSGFHPLWVRNGSGIDVEHLHITNTPSSGVMVSPASAGHVIDDVTLSYVLATRCSLSGSAGSDGIKIGWSQVNALGAITNISLYRCVARDNAGHGIKVRDGVVGAMVRECVAIRNGTGSAAHAMGTSGSFSTATGSGWTNISGNVWEKPLTHPLNPSVTAWLGVWVIGAAPYYYFPPSATPATPGLGESGIGAANTIRINAGAVNPNTLSQVWVIFGRPERVWFVNCVGADTTDADGIEGQGIYFDNGSLRCYSLGCASFDNEGQGYYMNDCIDSGHYGGFAMGNKKGGVSVIRGQRTNIHGMTLVCEPGTNGINYSTGNAQARARMNKIIGAAVGIGTNSQSTNAVAEDENQFIACGQRLLNVSSAGARSADVLSVNGVFLRLDRLTRLADTLI